MSTKEQSVNFWNQRLPLFAAFCELDNLFWKQSGNSTKSNLKAKTNIQDLRWRNLFIGDMSIAPRNEHPHSAAARG
jgi:hypothetical protein